MKFLFATALAAMAIAGSVPANAALLGSLPPPAILLTFEKTMASVKTLSVQVEASASDSILDHATITLVAPNKLRIDAVTDTEHEALISDGKKLKQWNKTSYYVGTSAPDFEDLNELMDFDSLAGDMAEEAFTTPKDFAVIPEFTDLGQRDDHGKIVDTLTATNFHGTKLLIVDSKTGLPLEYDYIRKHGGFTIRFSDYAINAHVPRSEFAEVVPAHLKKYVEPKQPPLLANGKPAPNFTLPTLDGQKLTLSSLKGQVVMIDFWASWCPPCKMSMPHVQAIYNDLKSQGLVVLSVNTWDDKSFAKEFLAKHPWYNTTFLIDATNYKKAISSTEYKVYGIPTLYIVDRSGNIADSYVDYEPDEEKALRADLAKLGLSKS